MEILSERIKYASKKLKIMYTNAISAVTLSRNTRKRCHHLYRISTSAG
jgi:hypothetical protein